MPWDQVVARALEHGVSGLVAVVLAYVVYRLYNRTEAIQNQRVADLQTQRDQAVRDSERSIAALTLATTALTETRLSVNDLRETVDKLGEEMRARRTRA